MVIAIPSASTVQGVARTSREGDRAEHAAANSELGHPPERGVPNSRPTPNAQARPERTSHQHHDGGPTRTSTHPYSLDNLGALRRDDGVGSRQVTELGDVGAPSGFGFDAWRWA